MVSHRHQGEPQQSDQSVARVPSPNLQQIPAAGPGCMACMGLDPPPDNLRGKCWWGRASPGMNLKILESGRASGTLAQPVKVVDGARTERGFGTRRVYTV